MARLDRHKKKPIEKKSNMELLLWLNIAATALLCTLLLMGRM